MSLLLAAAPAASPSAAPRPRHWLLPLVALLAVLVGLAASVVLAAPGLVSFAAVAPRAEGAPYITVPEYGAKGAYILGYEHGGQVRMTLPVTNAGRLPVTLTSVDLGGGPAPLLAVRGVQGLPVTIWPGHTAVVTVAAVLTNCRYYHERALEIFDGVTVGFRSLGRAGTRTAAYDRPILLKAPMLVGCPGRKLDRSAENRSDLL